MAEQQTYGFEEVQSSSKKLSAWIDEMRLAPQWWGVREFAAFEPFVTFMAEKKSGLNWLLVQDTNSQLGMDAVAIELHAMNR